MSRASKNKRATWVTAPNRRWPEYLEIEASEMTMQVGPDPDAAATAHHDDDPDSPGQVEKVRVPKPPVGEILDFGPLATTRRASPAPPIPRPASLPTLHTNFNRTKSAAAATRMFASSGLFHPNFRDGDQHGSSHALKGVWQK